MILRVAFIAIYVEQDVKLICQLRLAIKKWKISLKIGKNENKMNKSKNPILFYKGVNKLRLEKFYRLIRQRKN